MHPISDPRTNADDRELTRIYCYVQAAFAIIRCHSTIFKFIRLVTALDTLRDNDRGDE